MNCKFRIILKLTWIIVDGDIFFFQLKKVSRELEYTVHSVQIQNYKIPKYYQF